MIGFFLNVSGVSRGDHFFNEYFYKWEFSFFFKVNYEEDMLMIKRIFVPMY